MKKIGIITFHRASNYGAVLQTYALARTMRELGADCEVVDYHAASIENAYRLLQWKGDIAKERFKTLRRCIRYILYSLRKNKRFSRFVKQYLPTSEPVTEKTISQYCAERYRAIIAGSDQVFSAHHAKGDLKNYLLAFASENTKRYSYAASFGGYFDTVTDDETAIFKRELAKFSEISVRESNGVEQVQNLTGRNAQVHLDPTLLVRKEEWITLCDESAERPPFIFMYMMHNASAAYSYAQKLSEEMNLPVVCLLGSARGEEKASFPGITYLRDCSPERFLGLVRDASYIITTSFHGTVFSILFRKPFVSFGSKKLKNDDRIKTLLNLTGLEDRLWSKDFRENVQIDWEYAESQLEQEREKARNYLRSIIT